jgi:hypothetical protein
VYSGPATEAGDILANGIDSAVYDEAGNLISSVGADGFPIVGTVLNLARGNVGGAAGGMIGFAIGGPIGGIVGGILGGVFGGGGGGSPCWITTAVCDHLGRPDDCDELQTLRKFRDEVMEQRQAWRVLVRIYDIIAPRIVEAIDAEEDPAAIYRALLDRFILPSVSFVKQDRHDEAVCLYSMMVEELLTNYFKESSHATHAA